jgi:hypothetical protein
MHAAQHCETKRMPRSGHDPGDVSIGLAALVLSLVLVYWTSRPRESRVSPREGYLAFALRDSNLAGGFALTRTGERRRILVKTRDAAARPGPDIIAERPASVRTGRTWEEVAVGQAGPERD